MLLTNMKITEMCRQIGIIKDKVTSSKRKKKRQKDYLVTPDAPVPRGHRGMTLSNSEYVMLPYSSFSESQSSSETAVVCTLALLRRNLASGL